MIAVVEPPHQPRPKNRWSYRERQWVRAWVQVTKLGLTAFKDAGSVDAWVTDLQTGKAVAGATRVDARRRGSARRGRTASRACRSDRSGDSLVATRNGDRVCVLGMHGAGTFEARTHGESHALVRVR